MASVDFYGIKERVVAILKADTTNIFSATSSDKSLFREIEAGKPTPKNINSLPLPRMWVTNDVLHSRVRSIASIDSNASNGKEYEFKLKIVFVVEDKDGPSTEEKIDDFTKVIIEKLEGNYDLRPDGGSENNRLADSTEIETIQELPQEFKGDRVQGRMLIFKVMVTA